MRFPITSRRVRRAPTGTVRGTRALSALALGAVVAAGAAPVAARDADGAGEQGLLKRIEGCVAIPDEKARLQCYDVQVAALVAAQKSGEVRVVQKEEIQKTRRQLFGFAVPRLGLLADGDDGESPEVLETTITSVRYGANQTIIFGTPEGATWEILQTSRRLAPVQVGDRVEFKRAALGSYFVRINGQIGVKGRRIQ